MTPTFISAAMNPPQADPTAGEAMTTEQSPPKATEVHVSDDASADFWDSLQLPDPDLETALLKSLTQEKVDPLLSVATEPDCTMLPTGTATIASISAPLPARRVTWPTESFREYRTHLTDIFGKMMFVSGETAEASAETTWLIEEIVREQVVHMVSFSLLYLHYLTSPAQSCYRIRQPPWSQIHYSG